MDWPTIVHVFSPRLSLDDSGHVIKWRIVIGRFAQPLPRLDGGGFDDELVCLGIGRHTLHHHLAGWGALGGRGSQRRKIFGAPHNFVISNYFMNQNKERRNKE